MASKTKKTKKSQKVDFPDLNPNPVFEIESGNILTYSNPAAKNIFTQFKKIIESHPLFADLDKVREQLKSQKVVIREIQDDEKTYEEQIISVPHSSKIKIFAYDVTERKELERTKDDFISTVSHEIRTPITIINSAITNFKQGLAGPLSDDQVKIIDIAYRNTQRLTRIINDILDLSRLESGRFKIIRRRLNLIKLIQDIVSSLQMKAMEKEIELVFETPLKLTDVYADGDTISQVLNNLLSNALRFATHRIVIKVKKEKTPDAWGVPTLRIQIIDDGPGIPPDQFSKLFTKFTQINRPQGGAGYKGTGLGLAICKEIVNSHEGKIWTENLKEGGASFQFTLQEYVEEKAFWFILKNRILEHKSLNKPLSLILMSLSSSNPSHLLIGQERKFLEDFNEVLNAKIIRKTDELLFYSSNLLGLILYDTSGKTANNVENRIQQVFTQWKVSHKELLQNTQLALGGASYPVWGHTEKEIFNNASKELEKNKQYHPYSHHPQPSIQNSSAENFKKDFKKDIS